MFARRIVLVPVTLGLIGTMAAGGWLWVKSGNSSSQPSTKTPPATVGKVVKEDEFNIVTLTEQAEKRIDLAVAPVVKKQVQRVRVYGGEITVPVGRAILVTAPLTGTLKAPVAGEIKAGQVVKAGQPLFQFTPLLTPDGRAMLAASMTEAEGQVNNAKAQTDLAKIALERARRVFNEGAGSQRQVDEAGAAFHVATKTLDAAKARYSILSNVVGDATGSASAPISIDAPTAGLLRIVSALPGQTVPAGAPLFEVIDVSTVWVRVPIPVGDLDAIARNDIAGVGKLSSPFSSPLVSAAPVLATPSANPLSATVDVFYEMPNSNGKLIPGTRVAVSVPLAGAKENPIVPWTAVYYDIDGGTWIYEQKSPHQYARRRCVVAYTFGSDAVLASGPALGTMVVVRGVPELFGVETGFAK